MSSRRTTSEPTVGRHVMRMLVSTEKHGDMIISGRRPIASESPPKIGETMKPSTPAIDSRLPCARACAASVRSSFSEAQEKTKRAAALTIAGVVVEPDLRLGLHAHHDAEGCAAAALDFFDRRRKGSGVHLLRHIMHSISAFTATSFAFFAACSFEAFAACSSSCSAASASWKTLRGGMVGVPPGPIAMAVRCRPYRDTNT